VTHLPYSTHNLAGTGGAIKAEPGHFIVEEQLAYEANGQGSHVFVTLRREGQTTKNILDRLGQMFSLKNVDIGVAGLKDKEARVTQTFSLNLPGYDCDKIEKQIFSEGDLELVNIARHNHKIKTGHLRGNRFTIILSDVSADAVEHIEKIIKILVKEGLPNFYGPQRFGTKGDNAEQGRDCLFGKGKRDPWLNRFLISSYTSELFNRYLLKRIEKNSLQKILRGDVAKKCATGGLFDVEDVKAEQQRFQKKEITFTGPIYGSKMRWASNEAGDIEKEIFEEENLSLELFKKKKVPGSRRVALLYIDAISYKSTPEGLRVEFFLPKGSYATVVLREIMKEEVLN